MKKITRSGIIIALLLLIFQQSVASNPFGEEYQYRRKVYKKGQKYSDFGLGVYGLFRVVEGETNVLTTFQNYSAPIFSYRFEYALSKIFGVSGTAHLQYAYFKWNKSIEVYDESTWTLTAMNFPERYSGLSFGLSARINWHFTGNQYNDFYFGAGMGYEVHAMTLKSDDPKASRSPDRPMPFIPQGVFGFRTHSDKAIYFAEIGYGKNIFTVGVSLLPD